MGVILLDACSTTKNTFVTRTFHNINSRYNGFFYARESMKEAQVKIGKSYIDDYSQLLPLFQLPTTPETKSSYSDLEKAIKKASTCIERHAITTKSGNEIANAVKWIDDCYLVIGKSHYIKGECLTALEIFDYIIQKYPNDITKSEALVWKARTQISLGALTDAESILDVISNDPSCPKNLQGEIKATYADLYLQTGSYLNAIKNLNGAIAQTKSKKKLARYTFILAQLYEKVGKEKSAFENFGAVVEMHPEYNMFFNAKLNRARLSAANEKNRTAAMKDLQKMLGDIKNIEYKDQIYYALAQLSIRSNNIPGAMVYYRQSIAYSMGNNKQKALSYLALGDIYFTDTDYKNAQAYFDSTLTFLPKDFPGYKSIFEKNKGLVNLVRYLNIISNEDSLLHIAKKYGGDTSTLYPFIDKLIAGIQAEEKRKKELEEQRILISNSPGNPGNPGGPSVSSFYFYNLSNVSFGINEFTRKWGSRKLEDNWRRSNKETLFTNDIENTEKPDEDPGSLKSSSKSGNAKYLRETYIKDLPLTAESVIKTNEKIADAIYNLATIYKEQMSNYKKATASFLELCERYPNHKYAIASHFQLWRLFKTDGNLTKAEEHKNYICNNFPESEYCSLIKNPNFETGKKNERAKLNEYYNVTYESYSKKNYLDVITRCDIADSLFGKKNEHSAKLAFIRAVSMGKTRGNATMEPELTKIIVNYPNDPIRKQAQALLDALLKTKQNKTIDTLTTPAGPIYLQSETGGYIYIVVVDKGKGDLNKFKIDISDYNLQMFASQGLTINSVILDNLHSCVSVKQFLTKKSALDYYTLLKSQPGLFKNLLPGTFQVMVISNENFLIFYKDKNIEPYKAFFELNFLKK